MEKINATKSLLYCKMIKKLNQQEMVTENPNQY